MRSSKFFLLFVIALFTSTTLLAQNPLKKGVYNLGGSVSLYFSHDEFDNMKNDYTDISLAPSFGYFITDNISLSGKLGFSYTENESSYNNGLTYKGYSHYYSIGASARYYFHAEKIIPFLGIGAEFSKYDSDMEGKRAIIIGGINYFLSKEVALEPYVSYTLSSYNRSNQKSSMFRFGVSVNYYLTD
jgi:hypothetical protein